jgi:hypothetical protein
VCWALRTVWAYDNTPGARGQVENNWPVSSKLSLAKDGDTLVLALHPNCSCSRATVDELADIVTHAAGKLTVHILAVRPPGLSIDPTHSALIEKAGALAGVTITLDDEGKEAALFGAKTSGHTNLYDAKGDLLFSGGITEARGHTGSNPGERALLSFVQGTPSSLNRTAVYGCSLLGEGNSR